MEKLLYNINSTSWFHTWSNGKVSKFEVFYLLMAITGGFLASSIAYEGHNDIYFGAFSKIASIPFLIFWTQYIVFSVFKGVVSQETEDHFWKTQLWRYKDPSYNFQKSLHLYPKFRLRELEKQWLETYGETANYTLENSPWIQKGRIVILIGFIAIGVFVGIYIF